MSRNRSHPVDPSRGNRGIDPHQYAAGYRAGRAEYSRPPRRRRRTGGWLLLLAILAGITILVLIGGSR